MSDQNPTAPAPSPDNVSSEQLESKSALSEHKGKLAIGVAAMLGVIVFYKWRERRLAKEDPEGYARLQRLKASVLHGEAEATAKEGDMAAPSQHASTVESQASK